MDRKMLRLQNKNYPTLNGCLHIDSLSRRLHMPHSHAYFYLDDQNYICYQERRNCLRIDHFESNAEDRLVQLIKAMKQYAKLRGKKKITFGCCLSAMDFNTLLFYGFQRVNPDSYEYKLCYDLENEADGRKFDEKNTE